MPEEMVRLSYDALKEPMKNKFKQAGLPEDQAEAVSEHLAYADARGVHSHGAVRVEYYCERISKGGTNCKPSMSFEQKSPSVGIFDGDNAAGHYVALQAMDKAIELAKESGVGVVGIKRLGHCGTLSYFIRKATEQGYVMISMAQSDPMVVLYGGTQPYFGTNPIGFGAPTSGAPIVFDMATTVGAWGKILDARAKNKSIPDTWAVDANGNPTTDPHAVAGLVPIAGAKGSGLMMMVDILCGSLLGQPFGGHVTSMYSELESGRELGQLHILINPDFFVGREQFIKNLDTMVGEIHGMKPAEGQDQVRLPGESSDRTYAKYQQEGIPITKEIYDYLVSEDVHFNRYGNMSAFAK